MQFVFFTSVLVFMNFPYSFFPKNYAMLTYRYAIGQDYDKKTRGEKRSKVI